MANLDAPFGLYPAIHPGGDPRVTRYYAASGAAAIGQGCLVQSNDGVVTVATSASTNIIGVCAYFVSSAKPTTDDHPDKLKAVYVYDNPEQVFVVQGGNTSVALTDETSYVGASYSLINASTFNSTTLQSKGEVDITTRKVVTPTQTTGAVLCVGLWDEGRRNDWDATNVGLRVRINPLVHAHSGHSTLT